MQHSLLRSHWREDSRQTVPGYNAFVGEVSNSW